MQALAFGLGCGAAIQAWRAFPESAPVTGDAVAVVFCAGLVVAFLGGLWHGRGNRGAHATATASASAVAASSAVNTVQVAVVVPGQGAASQGVGVPTSSAPWLLGVEDRREITADDVEGMDLSELFETPEPEEA